jgi:glycosyltransferase involved in cell wall biosynthesis
VVAGATDSATYAARLKQRVDELGLSRRFHLPGFRNDLPELLAGSDIFVLSSKAEGASYVLIEAMACGCAVIASRCGGYVDELITSGETGLLTDYGDAAGLAQSILQLAESPARRKRMTKAGLARVEESGFDIGQSTAKLMFVYERLLDSPTPAKGAFAIDLFLQAAAEAGDLGSRLTSLEERLKTLEQTALTHPRQSARRWLRKWLKK